MRGALTGIVVGGFAAVVIDANIIAVKALWRLNCLAAETAWDIFKAPLERVIHRELQRQRQPCKQRTKTTLNQTNLENKP